MVGLLGSTTRCPSVFTMIWKTNATPLPHTSTPPIKSRRGTDGSQRGTVPLVSNSLKFLIYSIDVKTFVTFVTFYLVTFLRFLTFLIFIWTYLHLLSTQLANFIVSSRPRKVGVCCTHLVLRNVELRRRPKLKLQYTEAREAIRKGKESDSPADRLEGLHLFCWACIG